MAGQGKPAFTGKAMQCEWLWLLPKSTIVKPVPIHVWAFKGKDGWTGWLETQRVKGASKVLPSFWSKGSWVETTEKKAEKAREAAKAAPVPAPVQPTRLTGKQIREAATAAGKAERAGKPGPVKVKAPTTPEPEPTPPTGTDPPGKAETVSHDETSVAAAVETAVQVLASVAQSLRTQAAERNGKARPGLAKTSGKPVATVKRRAGRRI